MRAFNVARPRQRNIYQITSPTTGIKFACIQTTKRTSFEQLFHLDCFTFVRTATLFGGELVGGVMISLWRVGWWRDGFSVASWLVAKLPGGEMTGYRDKGSRQ